MIEKKIEQNFSQKYILNLNYNEYCIYDSRIDSNKIIGFYTTGIVTCSCFIISINKDEIIFFSHISEYSDIINTINEKLIPLLQKIKIYDINLIYTNGIKSLKNINKIKAIEEIAKNIDEIFYSSRHVILHDSLISCLKLISKNGGSIYYQKFKDYKIKRCDDKLKKLKKAQDYILLAKSSFEQNLIMEKNIICYLEINELKNVGEEYEIIII